MIVPDPSLTANYDPNWKKDQLVNNTIAENNVANGIYSFLGTNDSTSLFFTNKPINTNSRNSYWENHVRRIFPAVSLVRNVNGPGTKKVVFQRFQAEKSNRKQEKIASLYLIAGNSFQFFRSLITTNFTIIRPSLLDTCNFNTTSRMDQLFKKRWNRIRELDLLFDRIKEIYLKELFALRNESKNSTIPISSLDLFERGQNYYEFGQSYHHYNYVSPASSKVYHDFWAHLRKISERPNHYKSIEALCKKTTWGHEISRTLHPTLPFTEILPYGFTEIDKALPLATIAKIAFQGLEKNIQELPKLPRRLMYTTIKIYGATCVVTALQAAYHHKPERDSRISQVQLLATGLELMGISPWTLAKRVVTNTISVAKKIFSILPSVYYIPGRH